MVAAVETMAYAGEVPWHGLGVRVNPNLTVKEMQEAAGVDWDVEKYPLFYNFDGAKRRAKMAALVRKTDGRLLSHVTDDWEPLQNSDAFNFFAEFVDAGDMEMHTAGSLKDGRVVWVLAKLKDGFELKFGKVADPVESYLLFANPHQFGKSINVQFTPIRVVCNNTLTMALNTVSQHMARWRHDTKFDEAAVKTVLGLTQADTARKMAEYKEQAEFLASKRFTKDTVQEYFMQVFPALTAANNNDVVSRNAKQAMAALTTQPGADMGAGTWWQPFNAVTYLTDHRLGRSANNRMYNAWYGQTRVLKANALETALTYAKAA